MLERTIKEMWTLEDIQMLRNELQALRDDEPVPFYTQIKAVRFSFENMNGNMADVGEVDGSYGAGSGGCD